MALLSPPSPSPLLAPVRHRLASHNLLAVPETPSSLLSLPHYHHSLLLPSAATAWPLRRHRRRGIAASVGQEEPGFTDTSITSVGEGASVPPLSFDAEAGAVTVSAEPADASPEDLESIREIKRVLELLQKNRDMTFGEVKLTIMIEDPRDVERKRLLGIEDPDDLTRDDLADVLVEDFQETAADPTHGRVPKLGMTFLSEEEAYFFYNKYAETIGFSIRRSSGHKMKNSSRMQQRTFTCSRQGFRGDDKREDTFSYSRPETRCGCTACMKISFRNGLYDVYEFEASHNHILAPGTMAHFLRSQRKVTEAQIANAEVAKSVGISNKATIDLMATQVGGIENLGCTREDIKNRLYTKRTIQAKEGDTGGC